MSSSVDTFHISNNFVEQLKSRKMAENISKKKELKKLVTVLTKYISNCITVDDESIYAKFCELELGGKRFIYLKELNLIIPRLDKLPKKSVKASESLLSSNYLSKLLDLPESINNKWSLIGYKRLKTLLSKKYNFIQNSKGLIQFDNNQTAQKILMLSNGKIGSINVQTDVVEYINNSYMGHILNSNIKGAIIPVFKLGTQSLDDVCKKFNFKPLGIKEKLGKLRDVNNDLEKLENSNEDNLKLSKEDIITYLINIDKRRAAIKEYPQNILTDPNRGSWDLFDGECCIGTKVAPLAFKGQFYARDPRTDIKRNGIVAIDFGTKSTVVIQENDKNQIFPLRVGQGNYSKEVKSSDYENPTVMEFINIDNFMKSYREVDGRPYTQWDDLTISHTANERIFESSSKDFSSIFSQLKQWCGESNHKRVIRDKNGYEFLLEDYLSLDGSKIDPIELYAYYLGLHINNMRNGIYLEYFLSFPVTYSLVVKEKIRKSFDTGLRKSIPNTVLEDNEVMKQFKVVQGCSEPAAYAVTALLEYGFRPVGEEKVFYGIFDFGGGTTDFDFGTWRESDDDDVEEERYDYVIEHFGASGDRFLGGENILDLLAFEVFKDNSTSLLDNSIQFVKPHDSELFPGHETLLSSSQDANLNMKKLTEELRAIWEKHEGYEEKFSSGILEINLSDSNSKQHSNFELDIDLVKIESVIEKRIDKGIKSFFESLKNVFHNNFGHDAIEINIFLAGNSCKSPVVEKLFHKHIEDVTLKMKKENIDSDNVFKLFNPLGGGSDDHFKPNGKTGVAYGIVKTKLGGKIKVINHSTDNNTSDRYKFYIGKSKKEQLRPIITPECEEEWVRYYAATEQHFEFYYTTNPSATTKKLPIVESQKMRASISVINPDANIYMKKEGINKLNIVVATPEDIKSNTYLEHVGEFVLN